MCNSGIYYDKLIKAKGVVARNLWLLKFGTKSVIFRADKVLVSVFFSAVNSKNHKFYFSHLTSAYILFLVNVTSIILGVGEEEL